MYNNDVIVCSLEGGRTVSLTHILIDSINDMLAFGVSNLGSPALTMRGFIKQRVMVLKISCILNMGYRKQGVVRIFLCSYIQAFRFVVDSNNT